MKYATIVVSPSYQNNKLFDLNDEVINRDNCMFPFFLLKEKFLHSKVLLATQDIHPIHDSSFVLYNEMPKHLPQKRDMHKSYLLLFESELIRPDNWNINNHQYFHKIFTWNDEIVDNKKYFKFNFAQEIPKKVNKDISKKEKLCTLIAGNKKNNHPLELYSKRLEAIRWFEKNHVNDFDFYGIGWGTYSHANKYINHLLKKIPLSPTYKTYNGMVESKYATLSKYKFVICYENARDIPGYITEKIFDCFFAGCVPIYWGASNITEHISKECFIDRRDFDSYEELYNFIKSMGKDDYMKYHDNVKKFLNSEKSYQFGSGFFVDKLINVIMDE